MKFREKKNYNFKNNKNSNLKNYSLENDRRHISKVNE